ncbi:YraN family protein [Chitinophaga oryzae]|uniref:YraN family protein n=1 Tax=Chitinophaga oryzae TaxID=2725414 RepID=A0AAE7D6K8_9BACT|nr:YraN family protein [Chitinophaga oryzae]QJB31381.1 YraN family protein [Chitinophaga oryzae]QJB37866.1 YraN family protein [Chitinophaga oryzae]
MHPQETGREGERIAQEYVRRFCTIRHTNWKCGRKEIDIIAENGGTVFFIEVKARNGDRFGWPEEAVDRRKQAHIQLVAAAYLEHFHLYPEAVRFDIIAVTFTAAGHELLHLRDVF